MTYLDEINIVLKEMNKFNENIILLQCTANYPTLDSEVNLLVLNTFKDRFDIITGFSDHTAGIGASPYAVAMGAKVLEKHFTLDKLQKGPDHKASLSPDELISYVKQIRVVEKYLGSSVKALTKSEIYTKLSLQKCLVAKNDIKKGDVITERNIIAKRAGGEGISALYFDSVIGSIAATDYSKDQIIEQ